MFSHSSQYQLSSQANGGGAGPSRGHEASSSQPNNLRTETSALTPHSLHSSQHSNVNL